MTTSQDTVIFNIDWFQSALNQCFIALSDPDTDYIIQTAGRDWAPEELYERLINLAAASEVELLEQAITFEDAEQKEMFWNMVYELEI